MVNDLCGRLSERYVSIVAEGHNASIRDLLGEEISQPQLLRVRVHPGNNCITAEAMNGYGTVRRGRQQGLSKRSPPKAYDAGQWFTQ
jgi:hypothetical protein